MLASSCGRKEGPAPGAGTGTISGAGRAGTTPGAGQTGTTPGAEKAGTTPGAVQQGTPAGGIPAKAQVEIANQKGVEKLMSCESLAELINKKKIPDQNIMVVLDGVGGTAIHIGDYKFVLHSRQNTIRNILQTDPSQRLPLLELAKKQHVDLTDEEKQKLIKESKVNLGKQLPKFLKDNKLTEQEFESQLLEMGRALKTGSRQAEQGLINEMINQELLVYAGRKAGFTKTAFNKYIEFKHSPKYEELQQFGELTAEQLREKLIEQFLADLMKKKIVDAAEIKDSDVLQTYNENKDKFKHHGRIKWSQIVVAAPKENLGAVESLSTQVKRQRPELKGADLDAEIKKTEELQHKKALEILEKVQKGEDFAKLSNEVTDDLPARAAKNGGDMGYMALDELKQNNLLKPVVSALQNLKPGEIYNEPIKTEFGWHIVKLTDMQNEGTIPFFEVKDNLKQMLAKQNEELAVRLWIIEKRKTVPIVINPEFERLLDEYLASAKAKAK